MTAEGSVATHDRDGLPVPSARATITALVGGAVVAPILVAADHLLMGRVVAAGAGRPADADAAPGDGVRTQVRLATGDAVVASITNPGRPTTFVLTHGLACDHRLWDDYLGRLAEVGTVVTWDMPGHGMSPPPANPGNALAPAALAAAVCDVVEGTTASSARIIMVGHSLGGLVSLLALRDHPALRDRVDAAVLIATPLTDLGRTMSESGRLGAVRAAGIRAGVSWALGNRVTHGLFSHPVNAVPTYGLVRNMGFGPRPQPGQVRRLRAALAATPAGIRQAALSGTFGIDLRGTLEDINIPTLVVVGDRDRIVPPRHSCELLDELGGSGLVRFPHAGHAVVVERATPITEHIHRFVAATTAADTG